MRRKHVCLWLISLLVVFVLGISTQAVAEDNSSIIKISNELGAQDKGNAYGLADREDALSGLASETAAAPLPPALAVLVLALGFGLKTFRDKSRD